MIQEVLTSRIADYIANIRSIVSYLISLHFIINHKSIVLDDIPIFFIFEYLWFFDIKNYSMRMYVPLVRNLKVIWIRDQRGKVYDFSVAVNF